METKSGDVQGM